MTSEIQRYELADIHGGGHVLIGSDTGDLVYHSDHASRVRELEEAVRILAKNLHIANHLLACNRVGRRPTEIMLDKANEERDALESNPIAADAVKEAGRGN